MISFSFKIKNPWAKDIDVQKNYFCTEPKLSENWALCVQASKMGAYNLFKLHVDSSWRGEDHAGPEIVVEVFGYFFNIKIYNVNHWNYDKGRWYTPEEYKRENSDV